MILNSRPCFTCLLISLASLNGFSQTSDEKKSETSNAEQTKTAPKQKRPPSEDGLIKLQARSVKQSSDIDIHIDEQAINAAVESAISVALRSVEIALEKIDVNIEPIEINLQNLDRDLRPLEITMPNLDIHIDPIHIHEGVRSFDRDNDELRNEQADTLLHDRDKNKEREEYKKMVKEKAKVNDKDYDRQAFKEKAKAASTEKNPEKDKYKEKVKDKAKVKDKNKDNSEGLKKIN